VEKPASAGIIEISDASCPMDSQWQLRSAGNRTGRVKVNAINIITNDTSPS